MAETLATSRGGGPSDNPRPARWLPVGVMFALALTGGAVLAWHQVKTDKEFQLRAYRMCLIILEQLANVDPGWQGAVSIAHEWTGEVLHDQGKLNEALASPDDFRFLEYSGLVVLTTSLSESDPGCVKTRTAAKCGKYNPFRTCSENANFAAIVP